MPTFSLSPRRTGYFYATLVVLLYGCGGQVDLNNRADAFSFTDQTGVAKSTLTTSNAVTLTGSFLALTAICNDACTAISINAKPFVAGQVAGVNSGDTIAIQVTSSASLNKTVIGTVVLGHTTSGVWSVTTTSNPGVDPCLGSPAIGQVCADGTVYAGLTPDGNVPMYAAPCDAGQNWNGSTCAGSATALKWAYGGTITVGAPSNATGRANTATEFAANANADGPYEAASFCKTLTINGRNDWYLPAQGELNVLYLNQVAIGGFNPSAPYYWSSTENGTGAAQAQSFADGSQIFCGKATNFH